MSNKDNNVIDTSKLMDEYRKKWGDEMKGLPIRVVLEMSFIMAQNMDNVDVMELSPTEILALEDKTAEGVIGDFQAKKNEKKDGKSGS